MAPVYLRNSDANSERATLKIFPMACRISGICFIWEKSSMFATHKERWVSKVSIRRAQVDSKRSLGLASPGTLSLRGGESFVPVAKGK